MRWAISTVPTHDTGVTHDDPRIALMDALRVVGFSGRIAVTSHREAEAERLAAAGADLVLEPFQDAADRAVELLSGQEDPVRIGFLPIGDEHPA